MLAVTFPLLLLYETSIIVSENVQKRRLKKEKEFFNS
jgi:sec-independent protein translocase protein TatC